MNEIFSVITIGGDRTIRPLWKLPHYLTHVCERWMELYQGLVSRSQKRPTLTHDSTLCQNLEHQEVFLAMQTLEIDIQLTGLPKPISELIKINSRLTSPGLSKLRCCTGDVT